MKLTDLLTRLVRKSHTHGPVTNEVPLDSDLQIMQEKLELMQGEVDALDTRVTVAEKQLQARGMLPRA